MNILKKIKQHFCEHNNMTETDVYTYYPPSPYEAHGSYYKNKHLKCKKCGKIFR